MASPEIPDKLFFRIGEVCEIAGVEPYVLRFWESEFSCLAPPKSKSGQRVYGKKDVETVLKIKELLYEKGFTIAGARKQLARNRRPELHRVLLHVRDELQKILDVLDASPGHGNRTRARVRRGESGERGVRD